MKTWFSGHQGGGETNSVSGFLCGGEVGMDGQGGPHFFQGQKPA